MILRSNLNTMTIPTTATMNDQSTTANLMESVLGQLQSEESSDLRQQIIALVNQSKQSRPALNSTVQYTYNLSNLDPIESNFSLDVPSNIWSFLRRLEGLVRDNHPGFSVIELYRDSFQKSRRPDIASYLDQVVLTTSKPKLPKEQKIENVNRILA